MLTDELAIIALFVGKATEQNECVRRKLRNVKLDIYTS